MLSAIPALNADPPPKIPRSCGFFHPVTRLHQEERPIAAGRSDGATRRVHVSPAARQTEDEHLSGIRITPP